MNFPLFVARKIYSNPDGRKNVSRPAIQIATTGIAIGLAVMIVSVCVVLGFKHTIRDKVIGFSSHIAVEAFGSGVQGGASGICMSDSMMKAISDIPGVKHVQRYSLKQGILKTDEDFLGVAFKGVGEEYDTTFFHNSLKAGAIPGFSSKASKNNILLSQTMANKLKLKVGDKVFAYFVDNDNVRARRFKVAGIYQTNLAQYDNAICLTDIYTTNRLNGWGGDQASGAEVTVKDYDNLQAVADRFIENVNRKQDKYGNTYTSATIQEMNPQIFSWLDLLDLNVWIILALMTSVAGFTMVSGLLIIILERTNMIGTLKALGAKNATIRHTFLWFAVFVIGKGMAIGNALGLAIVLLQHFTGLITLDASVYYVSTVPVEINWLLILALNIATLLISVFVLIAPSYLISHIHPAKSMKYE